MEICKELRQLCKVCMSHFDELCQDRSEKISVFSITLDSHTIWGGNGDSDTDITFYITRSGWIVQETTTESGLYQKGSGVVKDSQRAVAESDIQRSLNGEKATIYDVQRLLSFYEQIRCKYPTEF